MLLRIWIMAVISIALGVAESKAADVLWYNKPASQWVEALPIGNGRLGAMVFGGTNREQLQLNEVTLWSGGPQLDADRKEAYKDLPKLRQLIREEKYEEAAKFANGHFNSPAPYDASYQTLGDLTFDFNLPTGEVTDYRRELDISQAIAKVQFTAGGVQFVRELFSSAPDHALVQKVSSNRAGAISFTLKFTRPKDLVAKAQSNDTLVLSGSTGKSLDYQANVKVIAKGGTVATSDDGTLRVQNADEAVIFLCAATSYVLDYDKGYKGADPARASEQLQAASAKTFDQLRDAHVADYRSFYDRVKLDLGQPDLARPTDERLASYRKDRDPSFAALFYQFGRYLLISSSRPDNPLPANLQGIWGDGLTMPWKADYHTNINVQMNYWPAESSNLSELHLPMIRLTENLVKPGTKSAKAYFGPETPGWIVTYTTNPWGWTSPGARLVWGIWFGGNGWMCQHLFEHYAFTRDVEYLKRVYPTMKSAAEFWMANMTESPDGHLIFSPGTSPENGFWTDEGLHGVITEGVTMDRAIAWELLDNTVQAARVLGIDKEFVEKAIKTRDRIQPMQIGKAGQLMEWNKDWDTNSKDPRHRHNSHVYGFHPGHQITTQGTPDLAAAVKKTLELRGDDGTGWSLAWKINCWARLRDGEHVLKLIDNQLRYTKEQRTVMADAGGTYLNLFDAHPPFQIDGNFGYVAGINEIFVQSNERYVDSRSPEQDRYIIDLLPALPSTWADGSVTGLRARGGFEVSLVWKNGKLDSATVKNVTSAKAQGRLRHGQRIVELDLDAGRELVFKPES